jgi:hypothetical protein
MPEFEFDITKDVTMTARVRVSASSIEEAHMLANRPSFFNDPEIEAKFELDDENVTTSVYIPDPDNWEEVSAAPKI